MKRSRRRKVTRLSGVDYFKQILKEEIHGHPKFYDLLIKLGKLHSDKNHDYAKGGRPLGNFERRAKIYSLYPGLNLSDPAVVAIVDAMKQLDAYLWQKSQGYEGKVEGKTGRLGDVSVYSIIDIILEEEKDNG